MEDFLQLFNVRDILLHIVNTLILFVAIRLLVYKPVRKFMNARTERVQAQMDEAAAREAEAKQALEDANAQREEAARLAVMAQAESAEQARASAAETVEEARRQAEDIVAAAQAEADAQRRAAQADIQAQALSMAVEIAEKMIGRELQNKDNDALAREFLTNVG